MKRLKSAIRARLRCAQMESHWGLAIGTPRVRTHTVDPTPDASRSYNLTLPIRLLIKDVWRQKCVLDSGVQDLQSLRICVSHAVSTKQNTLVARSTTSIWQQMELIENSREFNSCFQFLGAKRILFVSDAELHSRHGGQNEKSFDDTSAEECPRRRISYISSWEPRPAEQVW